MGANEPSRVAIVDPGDFTPAYDLALAAGLLETGHIVRLIGKCGFDEASRPAFRCEHFYRGLNTPLARRLPAPMLRSAKGLLHGLNIASLGRKLGAWRPDVVHFQWLPLPILDALLLVRLQHWVPVVVTLHDSNPYNGAAGWIMRTGYLATVRKADAVIVHTLQAADQLVAAGVARDRVHRLPHGLLHPPQPEASKQNTRRGRSRLCLLLFGKIRAYKGIDVLLEALTRLTPDERSRLKVRVVGQPYIDIRPLRRFADDHKLGSVVEFRFGFVGEGEIDNLFSTADAALFPYREIDASGAAMIAVAYGLPILASAIGGFVEEFRDGREARLVPPGSAVALAEVLREWIRSPEALDNLATGMRQHRSRVADWTAIGRLTSGVYAAARTAWRHHG